jgi:hypothetical protein
MRYTFLAPLMLLALTLIAVSAWAAEFRAGAGKSDIQTFPDMWPIQGFTSQHDSLEARVLLIDDDRTLAAIVVIDMTSISAETIGRIKAILTRVAGVSAESTIVVASHTFSAPHVFGAAPPVPGNQELTRVPGGPPAAAAEDGKRKASEEKSGQDPAVAAFAKSLETAVNRAAVQAKDSLQPARVGFGVGTTDISVNRDVPTPRGWWLGADAAGFSDRSIPLVRIDTSDGKPLALLINAAVQPSVMDHSENLDGGKPVSADIAGASTRFVEQWYGGGTVACFLIGAAGDQAPIFQGNRYVIRPDGSITRIDIHQAGFQLVDLIGERLGSEALRTSETIKTARPSSIQVWRRTVEVNSQLRSNDLPIGPVESYDYHPGPRVQVPVTLMRIGDIALVGVQVEFAAIVGAEIKAHSPYPHTLLITMVDGAAKYMADAKSYDHFTYEARNSSYARGAAEQVASAIHGFLEEMYNSSTERH